MWAGPEAGRCLLAPAGAGAVTVAKAKGEKCGGFAFHYVCCSMHSAATSARMEMSDSFELLLVACPTGPVSFSFFAVAMSRGGNRVT